MLTNKGLTRGGEGWGVVFRFTQVVKRMKPGAILDCVRTAY